MYEDRIVLNYEYVSIISYRVVLELKKVDFFLCQQDQMVHRDDIDILLVFV